MKLTAILATDSHGALGLKDKMPWPRLHRDMLRFSNATQGKMCIVGRKTFQTLPVLRNRRLVVVSRRFLCEDIGAQVVAPSMEAALNYAQNESEVMVIGGAEIYRLAWSKVDRLLLTVVDGIFKADTWFDTPRVMTENFVQLSQSVCDPDDQNPVRSTLQEWVRK